MTLLDDLGARLATQVGSEPAPDPGDHPADDPAGRPDGAGPGGGRSPAGPRTLTVQRVCVRSLARAAAAVSALTLATLVVGGVLAWWVATLTGRVGALESVVADSLGVDAVTLPAGRILATFSVVAALALAAAVGAILLGAAVFNRVSSSVGGIKLDVTPEAGLFAGPA